MVDDKYAFDNSEEKTYQDNITQEGEYLFVIEDISIASIPGYQGAEAKMGYKFKMKCLTDGDFYGYVLEPKMTMSRFKGSEPYVKKDGTTVDALNPSKLHTLLEAIYGENYYDGIFPAKRTINDLVGEQVTGYVATKDVITPKGNEITYGNIRDYRKANKTLTKDEMKALDDKHGIEQTSSSKLSDIFDLQEEKKKKDDDLPF